jgi:hypothetical protein
MLLYGTVGMLVDEVWHFYNDIYQRDGRILESLNGDFEFRLPANYETSINR